MSERLFGARPNQVIEKDKPLPAPWQVRGRRRLRVMSAYQSMSAPATAFLESGHFGPFHTAGRQCNLSE
jgi:hypothetical protein